MPIVTATAKIIDGSLSPTEAVRNLMNLPMIPEDIHLMVLWENNPENWKVSGIDKPYTYLELKAFVEDEEPIQISKQERFIICKLDDQTAMGTIDLFDVNFIHGFGSVGILIAESENRNKGYASESLDLLSQYAKNELGLRNLKCSIQSDNQASIKLFEKAGYKFIGKHENWFVDGAKFTDELLFQKQL